MIAKTKMITSNNNLKYPLFWTVCFFSITVPQLMAESKDTYIVHMDLSAMPKPFSTHHSWYLNTLSSISSHINTDSSSSSSSKLVYAYSNAINGFSALLSSSEFDAIKNSPGYISSTKDTTVKVDTTHTYQFLGLDSSHGGAWSLSNYGDDVIIGLVDTGVWPESRSFNDDGMTAIPSRWKGKCERGTEFDPSMCNKKLIGARYFNKGLLAKYPNLTISMNSARDTDGHGTHTSSTAAGAHVEGASFFGYAAGTASGAAPGARVAMYKALWDEGAYLSDILAAIDQAIADGVDVLSLSLGIDGLALFADPIAIATFAAMEKGIFVSTSAGNEGPGLETLHNGTPWVLNVAAGTIDREFQGTLFLNNGASVTGLSFYPGNSSAQFVPIVFLGGACQNDRLINEAAGKIVVCLDTNNWLSKQIYHVGNSNVSGAVFISNTTDLESFTQTSFPAIFFKIGKQAQKVIDYIKRDRATAKARINFRETLIGSKRAPQLAGYSSRGPSQSCPFVLKPDILAPGDMILASWPSNSPVAYLNSGQLFGDFNVISGTSMSCPHAAGVAALVKAAHPDWSPAAIRSAMMTTSYVLDNMKEPIKDTGFSNRPANPLGIGAGHVDPNKALDPGLVYDAGSEDYVNLLCGLKFSDDQIKTITRSKSYNCSIPSLDLNYPSFIAYLNGGDSGSIHKAIEFRRSVTNVGDAKSIYDAKLTTLEGLNVSVSPNRLRFTNKYEKKSYKLRIQGSEMFIGVVHGSLTWVQSNGKYQVKSPIVATTLVL